MHATDLVLGYDFGTSAVKAALFTREGTIAAASRAAYPLRHPEPGHAEQEPHDWWRAMAQATHPLLAAVPAAAERVAALGIAAQMCGCIAADAHGNPLHPCLIWSDTRSAAIAREITAGGPRIAGYGAFTLARWLWLANGAPNLLGRDPLSKMLWLRRERPQVWSRAARLLDVKDWLVQQCTGEATTTPDVAQLTWLMDNRRGRRGWSDAWLAKFGIPRERLPVIVDAASLAGTLTGAAAAHLGLRAGLPVSGGVGDVNAAALGAGDLGEGAYHLYLGTSLWVAAHSRRRRVNIFTGIGTLCSALPDRYLVVATQDQAGSLVSAAAERLGFGEGAAGLRALDEAASRVEDELAYGVLAHVALKARRALAQAQSCLRSASSVLRLTGGGAESLTWARIVADMLQQPLQLMEAPAFSGARGAAMTAASTAGWFATLEEAAAMARPGPLLEPARAPREWAEDRYQELLRRPADA